MDYAVVLYFDRKSEEKLTRYMHSLCEKGVNTYMLDMGIRPHITLAIFNDMNGDSIRSDLHRFAKESAKFKVRLESIGIFNSDSGVVYLSPVITDPLIQIHNGFYEFFKDVLHQYIAYYLPGLWTPHCTMATRLRRTEIMAAIGSLLEEFQPMEAEVCEIGFVECDAARELCCFEIQKYYLSEEQGDAD